MKKRRYTDFFMSVDDETNLNQRLIRYEFLDGRLMRYVMTEHELSVEDQNSLREILVSFPHASLSNRTEGWNEKFSSLNFSAYHSSILSLAANAYDSYGNTMLGVACEFGHSVEAVQRLIDIGAELDTPDQNMNKLPLHWAICNKLSFSSPDLEDAVIVVKCLLENGARTDLTCYRMTPLEYARDRGYSAAVRLIELHDERKSAKIA